MGKQAIKVVLITAALGIIGLLSYAAGQAWMVPSLGSALFTQAFNPELPAAKPYGILAGQLLGAAAGFVGVLVAGAGVLPPFLSGHELAGGRVLAAVIATALAAAFQVAAKATSPAGAATALLVAVGAETASWAGAGRMLVGILLVTALGEGVRQAVLRLR